MRKKTSPKSRFWPKVNKNGPNGCWIWTGARTRQGYGTIGPGGRGTPILVHRFSYSIHKGPLPDKGVIMHICDVPACVNPDHLVAGTQSQNILDAVAKGRQKTCEDNPTSKLKNHDVIMMKRMYENGVLKSHIAKMFGVSKTWVKKIVTNQVWRRL